MVCLRYLALFADVALPANAVACVAALEVLSTLGQAHERRINDAHETRNSNFVTASGHLLLDRHSARNRSWVLDLPALSCWHDVAARKLQIDIFLNEMAFLLAWVSTLQRARVITALLGPRALLDAFDSLVNEV